MLPWLILGIVGVVLAAVLLQIMQRNRAIESQLRLSESERRALQNKLSGESQLTRNLLDAIPEGLLVLDEQQHIVLFNLTANDLLGPDLLQKTLMAATRNYELDALVQQRDAEDNEKHVRLQNRAIRARIFHFKDQQPQTSILVLHDETELVRLSRARKEMVANISHELRHPITTIGLLAETLLKDDSHKPKKIRKMLKNIRRETDTLTQLVQEMRDLSLIESGQMPATFTNTNLLRVVNESLEPLLSLAERKSQQVRITISESIVVLADASQIERVLRNIVHNAIKFTPDKGRIDISASASANTETATISVSDTGSGIDEAHLPRIFERFYQEDFARSEGTGLGLAIARHIVLAHEGSLWADRNPDYGTTFFFTLPLADAQSGK